jgi:hypothetical protein
VLLPKGSDAPETLEKATYWLHQAAESDFAPAQIELAISYLMGQGVEVDQAEGYKWTLIGTENGDERGPQLLTHCTQNLAPGVMEMGRLRADAFRNTDSRIKPE